MSNTFPKILFVILHVLHFVFFPIGSIASPGTSPVYLGDPFVLLYDGTYYAYGTSSADGIRVYTSDDLETWKEPTRKLALNKADVWGEKWFWAPEVHFHKGKFYMFYTAEEHICVATSDSPLGPFTQKEKKPMIADEKCIDNSLFIDEGRPYMLYDRFNDGLNIWIAELETDLLHIKKGTEKPVIQVSQDWEKVWPRVNEGAFVIKHHGKYYLTYSANSYESPFYGIGFATSDKITGPWKKYDANPIFQKPKDLVGVGHSATFIDKNGKPRIVFHSHHDQQRIHPRIMHIGEVYFEEEKGEQVMRVKPDFSTPTLIRKDPTFKNPVFQPVLADPSVIKDPKTGLYYAYGTQDNWDDGKGSRLVPILESKDMVNWKYVGSAFQTKPTWKNAGGIWAPDINYVDGKYYLYYSFSTWGDPDPGVGLAISDSPKGPFIDQGKLFSSKGIDVPNSIDPFYHEDQGKKYLFWGSFNDGPKQGTFAVELEEDGKTLKNTEKVKIAAGDFEAVTIYKKGEYYYFLGSKGSCCEGANSKYHVLVGRSKQLLGPYVDQQGRDLRERGHGTLILQGTPDIAGPGHTSGIIADDQGKEWIYYHGIDKKHGKLPNNTSRRMLFLDEVNWNNGWPIIGAGKANLNDIPMPTVRPTNRRQETLPGNPLKVALGDPYIIYDDTSDRYYLYGTGGTKNGFVAYSSSDLKDWKKEGVIYTNIQEKAWGTKDFWAPEVYKWNDKFYLFYSAHWKNNPNNELENYKIGVAVSDKPTGPFVDMTGEPLFDPGYPIIDANVFVEESGKMYLYYSRCCYKHPVESEISQWAKQQGIFSEIEESWVYGVELKPDLSGVIGEPEMLLRPPLKMDDVQAEWESRSVNNKEVNRRWTEGSYMIKQQDTYYMMYSANFYAGKYYAVGYATSKNPLGPFKKSKHNPVLEKNTEKGGDVTGTGHNSILVGRGGKMYCVYHGRTTQSGQDRVVFIDEMEIDKKGVLKVHGPTTK